jgi:predicted N-acetyltransferase YhbS
LALNVRFDVFLALGLKENYLKNCSGKIEYSKE